MQTASNVTTVYEHGPSEHLNFLKSYRAMFSLFETLAMFKHELLLIIDREKQKRSIDWLKKRLEVMIYWFFSKKYGNSV